MNALRIQANLIREHIKILRSESEGEVTFIKSYDDNTVAGINVRICDTNPSIRNIKRVTVSRVPLP